MFVEISPTDFCMFDLANTPTKRSIAKKKKKKKKKKKNVNLDIFKSCTYFAFEAKLLEIEPEDTIRFLHYVQVFSIQKRYIKEKI